LTGTTSLLLTKKREKTGKSVKKSSVEKKIGGKALDFVLRAPSCAGKRPQQLLLARPPDCFLL
jgi:hypothetical protein